MKIDNLNETTGYLFILEVSHPFLELAASNHANTAELGNMRLNNLGL